MPKLNLFMNHHAEGESLEKFKGGRDYLVYWEGSWFLCAAYHVRGRRYLTTESGTDFCETDDFLWTELPMEVSDNG